MKNILLFTTFLIFSGYLFGDNGEKVSGFIKYRQVLTGQDNGFEANSGSAIGLNLKYHSKNYSGLQGFVSFFYDGPVEIFTDRDKKIPSGYFMNSDKSEYSTLGESYLRYKVDGYTFTAGRRHPNLSLKCESQNPMAKYRFSFVPNMFESYGIKYKGFRETTVGLSHITKFSFGARATTDYGFLGEYTDSGGVVVNPAEISGQFLNIGRVAGLNRDTLGITMFAYLTEFDDFKFQLWNYYAYEISNIAYVQGDYSQKFGEFDLSYSLQFLNQIGTGEEKHLESLRASMFGAMATGKYRSITSSISVNRSFGDEFFNFFGMDPTYTSSVYSRNAFRKEVTAYKLATAYKFNKQWKLSVSYSDYGQSKSVNSKGWEAQTDATESDIVLAYKPRKDVVMKLLGALRTSEYNGVIVNDEVKDRTMETIRFGVDYKF